MIPPFLAKYGAIGLAALSALTFVYLQGRSDAHQKCLRDALKGANAAVKEDQSDRKTQIESGADSLREFTDEVAALRRQIANRNNTNVEDGRTCLDAADGMQLLDDYDEIFEKGLHP